MNTILLIAVSAISVLLFYSSGKLSVDRATKLPSNIFWILGLIFWFVMFTIINSWGDGEYKRGQIDALTGNQKYHLITNPDKTVEWKEL